MINMIIAADENGGIGYKNGLPWPKNEKDLKYFQKITEGNVIVMGSNTWRSSGTYYHNSDNAIKYVVSSQSMFNFPGAFDTYDPTHDKIDDILLSIEFRHPGREVFIIGGKTLYDAAYKICDRVYLTDIHGKYRCDTFCDISKYIENKSIVSSTSEAATRSGPGIQFSIWEAN